MMRMTPKQQLIEAMIHTKISDNHEKALNYDLNKFFQRLKEKVLTELEEYYPKDEGGVLLQGQVDLILSPIFESQKEYYTILEKYNKKEYRHGKTQGKRLVRLAQKMSNTASKSEQTKIKIDDIVTADIKKDELFGVNEWTQDRLLNKSFIASESTMNRVDENINNIITDGYTKGMGIKTVRNDIHKRFDQLSTWESNRIARTEIHNAHMMGMMNTYHEMGVEYTQWSAAHDSRVRDTHAELDGEIIPLGGTYSNGLKHPGDTNGNIKEWINCRCGNLPYIIPDGYIAPSFTPFRESELIPTLDLYNSDEINIEIINDEIAQVKGFEIENLPFDKKFMKREFAITPHELAEDFNISDKAMKVIHQFQKESFNSVIEIGLAFNENNGKILTGKAIGDVDGVIIRTPKKCTTIHNHLNESFNPPSGDDFYTFLKNGKERLGINISNNETWIMQYTEKKVGLSNKYINKISHDIDEFASEISEKFKQQYHEELRRIKEEISNPKIRENEIINLKKKVNNEYLEKYNDKLGDKILKYASDIKGLKVKRYKNVKFNKDKIENLPKLKKEYNDNKEFPKRGNIINSEGALDKYLLSESQQTRFNELKAKSKLTFPERKEIKRLEGQIRFNELHNKLISEGKLSRELEKEYTSLQTMLEQILTKTNTKSIQKNIFKNPKAFHLTDDEKKLLNDLNQKRKNKTTTPEDNVKLRQLRSKKRISNYHEKLIKEGLNEGDTNNYISEYKRLSDLGYDLPDLSVNLKFTTPKPSWEEYTYTNVKIGNKFELNKKELDEVYVLEKKKLLSENGLLKSKISESELKHLDDLNSQRHFNFLYYINKGECGLEYKQYVEFKKLFKRFKKKFNLDAKILKQELPKYNHKVKSEEIKSNSDVIKLKGKYEDGLPPGYDIEELFSVDLRNCTLNEQRVIIRWMGNDFTFFRDYLVRCEGDIKKFLKYIKNASKKQLEHYTRYNALIRDGKFKEAENEIIDIAKSIEHDLPVLDNILNNNMTKKAMTLWRVEGRHHLGDNPKVGDIVIFKGKNSTAITKEGAEHFGEVTNRKMEWTYEIEAPVGTRGAYVSHINDSEKIRKEMEYLLADDTEMEIIKFDEKKKFAKLRILPRKKGALKSLHNLKNKILSLNGSVRYVYLE